MRSELATGGAPDEPGSDGDWTTTRVRPGYFSFGPMIRVVAAAGDAPAPVEVGLRPVSRVLDWGWKEEVAPVFAEIRALLGDDRRYPPAPEPPARAGQARRRRRPRERRAGPANRHTSRSSSLARRYVHTAKGVAGESCDRAGLPMRCC